MKRILVIEDQAPMLRNLALLLEFEGYRVLTASDGREGLEVARRDKPDLVICDVMMPELDGFGVVRALRAEDETADIPFIFLTARGERADVRTGMNEGADDYLTKPVIREELLEAVATRLARAAAVRERIAQVRGGGGFHPDFSSHEPLRARLGLTPREAEVLLWVAQGKTNGDIATILGLSEKTVKQHLGSSFQKLGVETRTGATLQALEVLANPRG
ncbi:MAG: response regulator transcription factor [Verrucomicrobiae bacterium]|nr:response regulator transcription factor [Verrucomicrobiae bacterium]